MGTAILGALVLALVVLVVVVRPGQLPDPEGAHEVSAAS